MPNLIFGDYDYKTPKDYLKAKPVSITFPVNNHLDKDKIERAKAWENRYSVRFWQFLALSTQPRFSTRMLK